IGDLLGVAAAPLEVSQNVSLLAAGGTPEQIIANLLSDDRYFNQVRIGHNVAGDDTNFVKQVFVDLVQRPASTAEVNTNVTNLSTAELTARYGQALTVLNDTPYRTKYITDSYLFFLGYSPSPTEISIQLSQFGLGITQEQFIANLMSSPIYFNRTPTILGVSGPPTNTTFVQAASKQ